MAVLAGCIAAFVPVVMAAAAPKLPLRPALVTDLFGYSSQGTPATNLVDEQALAGDPRSGHGGNVTTPWNPTWQPDWYAYTPRPQAAVSLDGAFAIESVWFAHGWGQLEFNLTFSLGGPLDPNATSVLVRVGSGGGAPTCGPVCWASAPLPAGLSARYVIVDLPRTPGGSLLELVAYGSTLDAGSARQTTTPRRSTAPTRPAPSGAGLERGAALRGSPPPLLRDFFGANVVGAVSGVANLSAVGHARMYFDWDWAERVQDQNRFQPTYSVGFEMDTYTAAVRAAGVPLHIADQGCAPFVHGGNASRSKWKPLSLKQMQTPGASTDPRSYADYASHAFQVAARYGSRTVDPSLLRLAAGQPVRSGLGTLAAFEAGNEWSATWNGREGYFSPLEYAAFLSAAFDGHEGTMGPGMGVRAADPTLAVSNAGLAELPGGMSVDYLEAMHVWSAAHRSDGRLPLDVVSVHHYSNSANAPPPALAPRGQGAGAASVGVSPEDDGLTARVGAYVAWAGRRAPGAGVWLGEFGYDTTGGPQAAPAIGSMSAEQVQAAWLVRSALLAAEGGASGAQMFMMADVNSKGPYRFSSSGLLADKAAGYAPKPSFFAFSAMTRAAGHLAYCGAGSDAVRSGEGVSVARLGGSAGCDGRPAAVVLWSPTSSDKVVEGFRWPAGGSGGGVATLMRLEAGAPLGVNTTLPVGADGTTAPFSVTETPCVLFLP